MSTPYDIQMSPVVVDQIMSFPLQEQAVVHNGLERLREAPAQRSRTSIPPREEPGRQMFDITHDAGDQRIRFTVDFQYFADEVNLWVRAIARSEFGAG